jgi:hypothetical protein
MMNEKVTKGSVFDWHTPDAGTVGAVRCTVNRVAGDGTWVDFTATAGGSSWGKRMKLPLPETFVQVK